MDLKKQLNELFEHYGEDLGDYAWLYESDRWVELIFCLLNQCVDQDPEIIREAASMLQNLDLLNTEDMVSLGKPGHEKTIAAAYVLKAHGFSEKEARRAIVLLASTAKAIQKTYGGKIQRYLRKHGMAMREELVNAIGFDSLDQGQLRYAITHWLQNALSLPISLEHQAILGFCRKNNVTLEDLLHTADDLDLNIALLDDLLEIEQKSKESGSGTEKAG